MSKELRTMEFNFRRIHPGLGKTQSKIMDILEDELETWGMIGIYDLASKVYYPDLRGATEWMYDKYPVTKSQINTVRRAVKALKKRSLVKRILVTPVKSSKGIRYRKVVGIVSDKY